jgi:hypothetical protein
MLNTMVKAITKSWNQLTSQEQGAISSRWGRQYMAWDLKKFMWVFNSDGWNPVEIGL